MRFKCRLKFQRRTRQDNYPQVDFNLPPAINWQMIYAQDWVSAESMLDGLPAGMAQGEDIIGR